MIQRAIKGEIVWSSVLLSKICKERGEMMEGIFIYRGMEKSF